jgi:hypothetical protein
MASRGSFAGKRSYTQCEVENAVVRKTFTKGV